MSAQIATREYQVKAAFVFNFTQFVEWSSQSFTTPQTSAVIGILGKDPFGNYLQETITGETINKHPLVIQHFNSVDDVNNCQVLFINISDKNQLRAILQKLKGKNILTISDVNGFAKMGGIVRLYTKDDKINIQINLEAAKEENLLISSKLLKLAEIVTTEKK
ncbi:MAG TPA: YfiR family protein [Bacteroidia bacterium]|nr:YfiR family protein [Bacteroidia bacterium]